MFLVVEGQDSKCPCLNPKYFLSLKHITCHALTHKMSGPRHLPVYQMKTHQYRSVMSTLITDRNYIKNCLSRNSNEKKKKNKKNNQEVSDDHGAGQGPSGVNSRNL